MNIMLACCAGMSTSLVVSKMEEAAKVVDGKAPVAVIDPVAYGSCDGAKVLKQAEDLVANA